MYTEQVGQVVRIPRPSQLSLRIIIWRRGWIATSTTTQHQQHRQQQVQQHQQRQRQQQRPSLRRIITLGTHTGHPSPLAVHPMLPPLPLMQRLQHIVQQRLQRINRYRHRPRLASHRRGALPPHPQLPHLYGPMTQLLVLLLQLLVVGVGVVVQAARQPFKRCPASVATLGARDQAPSLRLLQEEEVLQEVEVEVLVVVDIGPYKVPSLLVLSHLLHRWVQQALAGVGHQPVVPCVVSTEVSSHLLGGNRRWLLRAHLVV